MEKNKPGISVLWIPPGTLPLTAYVLVLYAVAEVVRFIIAHLSLS